MLLRQSVLEGIRSGDITLAFRGWRRPTVKTGGTLRTLIGELHIESVDVISLDDVTPAEAKRAGYPSLQALKEELQRFDGQVYRIAFGAVSRDRRVDLRGRKPAPDEMQAILTMLASMDRRAPRPWIAATLRLIDQHPGVLHLQVEDNGAGLTAPHPSSNGIGLGALRERLLRMYPTTTVTIEQRPEGGCAVTVRMPA